MKINKDQIAQMISMLLNLVTPDILKEGFDALLDKIEEAVRKSENTIDDMIVIRACSIIREAFDIPDND